MSGRFIIFRIGPGTMKGFGLLMMLAGGLLLTAGLVVFGLGHIPGLGRLPGDIRIEGQHGTFYFPLATSLLVSVVLTILLNLVFRFFGRP